MIYEVVYCADCKKPIKSIPSWLAGVNVRFTCESCRQRHPRGPMGFDGPVGGRLSEDADAESEDHQMAAPGELVAEEEDIPIEDVEAEAEEPVAVED